MEDSIVLAWIFEGKEKELEEVVLIGGKDEGETVEGV